MQNMTEEQKQRMFLNWHNQWIVPELERRHGKDNIPEDTKVTECLVLLPKGQTPIVKFNGEFGWSVKDPGLSDGRSIADLEIGQSVYLYDILTIDNVLPPTVDGVRVAFMYLFKGEMGWQLYVDFIPNQPDYDPHDESNKFDGTIIAHHLQHQLLLKVVQWAKAHTAQLNEIGLWIATSLLPYPLSMIVEKVTEGKPEEARQLLIDHCDLAFLNEHIVSTWKPIKAFNQRMNFFDDAMFNYESGRYHGALSILAAQIEGVITDWLFEVEYYREDKKRHIRAKFSDFREALSKIPALLWLYREAHDSMLSFLESGPWLQQFELWNQDVNSSFPGRHVVQHGKYSSDMFTQENSIKMFLMLDTICQFMMFYEARVMGRDLTQSAKGDE